MMSRDRRTFLRQSIAAGAAMLSARAGRSADRPNVLYILTDDLRPDGVGALGNPQLRTPHLDELVGRGMAFTRAYTMGSNSGAVCTPSRTMILSGRTVFHHPNGGFAKPPAGPEALFATTMADAGYETFHLGKRGNSYLAGMQAFQTCLYTEQIGADNHETSSEKCADRVISFLRDRQKTKPFFAYLAPPVPHDPRVAPKQFMDMYDPATIRVPERFMPVHPFDNGEMAVRDEQLAPWPRTEAVVQRHLADYYGCITCLDHHLGRIFAELRAQGQLDNTLIVFAGDNGLSLGDHGLMGKQNLYEYGGMHVPLVFAGPGVPAGRSDALAYLFDSYPTVCELTGVKVPALVEASSLKPVISGAAKGVRNALFTGYRACQRAVRDDRWKVIRYPLVDRTQLFDLQTDPCELHDLAGQPQHAAKQAEMMALLAAQQKLYGDPVPLTVANPKPAAWTPPAPAKAG